MEKLAKMAKLKVSDTEKLKADIDNMIKMAEVLNEIDVETGLDDEEGFLREDDVKPSFERAEMLNNAPKVKEGYIVVPKVVGD